jgi:hypothetical protein
MCCRSEQYAAGRPDRALNCITQAHCRKTVEPASHTTVQPLLCSTHPLSKHTTSTLWAKSTAPAVCIRSPVCHLVSRRPPGAHPGMWAHVLQGALARPPMLGPKMQPMPQDSDM